MNRLVFLLLAFTQLCGAFTPINNFVPRPVTLFAGEGDADKAGGAAIAKPKIKTSQKVETKQKQKSKQTQQAKTHDPISRREEKFEDAPMYKLMLIGDESYDPETVERICHVVEGMDEDQAATITEQAVQGGEAMIGIYHLEKAERFKDGLLMSNPIIYSEVKKENKD